MKSPILLLIFLLMYFGWINATKSRDASNNSVNRNFPEESITIKVKPSSGKVVRCKLQVENHADFIDEVYYYDTSGIIKSVGSDYIEYIGDKDNSCSFTIYPNRRKDLFAFQHFGALYKPWRIVGLYKADSRWDCIFDYDSDLETCEQLDIVSVNLHDIRTSMSTRTAKVIRKSSSYENDTITIYAPTEDMKVYSCSLYLTSKPIFNAVMPFSQGQIIMQYFSRPSFNLQSSQPDYEYIGQDDNSCSLKLKNLDVFDENYMDKYWYVSVDIVSDNDWADVLSSQMLSIAGYRMHFNYYFYMKPLSWWRKNNYSNVYLWPNNNDDDHLFYVEPQYF